MLLLNATKKRNNPDPRKQKPTSNGTKSLPSKRSSKTNPSRFAKAISTQTKKENRDEKRLPLQRNNTLTLEALSAYPPRVKCVASASTAISLFLNRLKGTLIGAGLSEFDADA